MIEQTNFVRSYVFCSIIWSEIGLMNDPDVIKHETIVYKYLTLYYGDEAIQRISWGDMINIFYSRALLLISLYKSCLQWNILITATKWYWKSWLSKIQVKLRMLSKSGGGGSKGLWLPISVPIISKYPFSAYFSHRFPFPNQSQRFSYINVVVFQCKAPECRQLIIKLVNRLLVRFRYQNIIESFK